MSLAWLLPGHDFPWTGFQQEAMAAAGAILVALGAVTRRSPAPLRTPLIAAAALALALVPICQWVAGLVVYASDAVLAAAYVAGFGLMIVAGDRLARADTSFIDRLLSAIGVGALCSFAIGTMQWLELGPYTLMLPSLPDARIGGNFGHPNHQATAMGLGIAAAWGLYERRRLGGPWALAAVMLFGVGLLMSRSRVGWLFVAVYATMWLGYRRRLRLRAPAAVLWGASAVFYALVPLWATLTAAVTGNAGILLSGRIASGERWTHLQTMWDASIKSPWVGYGWNQISLAQQATALDHPATFEWLTSSHNQLLDLIVWNGFPIGLLVLGVIVWWSVTRMRRCDGTGAWAAILALGVLLAHAMVEYPLAYAYFLLPAGLLVGAAEGATPSFEEKANHPQSRRAAYLACVALTAGIYFVACTEYLDVQQTVERIRMRDAGYAANPRVPDLRLLDAPREYLRLWITLNDDGDPGVDLSWLRTVASRHATPPALMRYAVAAAIRGHREEARRTLQLMCSISKPRHCDEGRGKWASLAERMPSLRMVGFPDTPILGEQRSDLARR